MVNVVFEIVGCLNPIRFNWGAGFDC